MYRIYYRCYYYPHFHGIYFCHGVGIYFVCCDSNILHFTQKISVYLPVRPLKFVCALISVRPPILYVH